MTILDEILEIIESLNSRVVLENIIVNYFSHSELKDLKDFFEREGYFDTEIED